MPLQVPSSVRGLLISLKEAFICIGVLSGYLGGYLLIDQVPVTYWLARSETQKNTECATSSIGLMQRTWAVLSHGRLLPVSLRKSTKSSLSETFTAQAAS